MQTARSSRVKQWLLGCKSAGIPKVSALGGWLTGISIVRGYTDLISFLGRCHPLLIHLPIGALCALGILELLSGFKRWQEVARNRRGLLGITCISAALSAACGWLLARTGEYNFELSSWHRMAGFAVVGGCVVTFVLCSAGRTRAYLISLTGTLALLTVAGDLGGSMTYGRGFPLVPSRFTGAPVQPARARTQPATSKSGKVKVFADIIQPILQRRCCECHGELKHKAGLRLDTFESVRLGGQDGPVINPGRSQASPLIQCISSPLEADGHMPPDGTPQLSLEEIAWLQLWIDSGAREDEPVESVAHNSHSRK